MILAENHWALKEWAVVCEALRRGRQTWILRKGGISEGPRGFEVEHPEFWLLPTRFHQSHEQLRDDVEAWLPSERLAPPPAGTLRIGLYARVRQVCQIRQEAELNQFVPLQILSAETVRDRFHYRQPGLFALQLDIYQLDQPHSLADAPEYAGCHSWVPLQSSLPTADMKEVTRDAEWIANDSQPGQSL